VPTGWDERLAGAVERHDDGAARLRESGDERQRQLTRMGNAAWAAGMSLLMLGRREEATDWLLRAAERYRESWPLAPPESWGRPIGAMKSRLTAGDRRGAESDARWAIVAGAGESDSPIGRYAAALARLVIGDDAVAATEARALQGREDFPSAVADALVALAERDAARYEQAIRALLADFEAREDFLEDVAVADTVLALQQLAKERGLAVELSSPLLPPAT
jgi:tetratricopeptide (TPR) repeat protein